MTPPATESAAALTSPPATSALPAEPVQARGGSGSAMPLAGGLVDGVPGGRSEARLPSGEGPGRRGVPLTERGPAGAGVGAAGRGAAAVRGGAGRLAGESPFAAGPAARREEERDHQVKYGLPSAEHFEPDDPELDPHRDGWHVAPEVIGDREEDV